MSTSTSKYKSTPTFAFRGWNKCTGNSIQAITSSNDPSLLPSPNHYNPQKVSLSKSPSSRFPKATRKQWDEIKSNKNVPGPGTFEPQSFTTDGPKKTISKVLFKKFVSLTPGPDKYHGDSIMLMRKQPSFSMQKKTASLHDILAFKNNGKPSPGAYEQPIMKFKSASAITIGKSKRRSVILNQKYPGPGSYEAEKSYHSSVLSESKCKIGKDKRNIDFSFRQKVPGPGSYDRRSFIEDNKVKRKGFSCRAKFMVNSSSLKVPGPGAYQTPLITNRSSSPEIKMAQSKRFTFTDRTIATFKNNPGPGSFDLQGVDRMKFRSMSVHKFSKSKSNYLSESLHSQSSQKLGPGFYNSEKYFNKRRSPEYSISKNKTREIFKKIQKFPSPNSYNPKLSLVQQSQFTHTMQTSQRSNIIKHLASIPGPGQYQSHIPDRLGVIFKFSKQRRQHIFDKSRSKEKLQINNQVYEPRESFPNPPKYMNVAPKLKFNEKNLNGYSK